MLVSNWYSLLEFLVDGVDRRTFENNVFFLGKILNTVFLYLLFLCMGFFGRRYVFIIS